MADKVTVQRSIIMNKPPDQDDSKEWKEGIHESKDAQDLIDLGPSTADKSIQNPNPNERPIQEKPNRQHDVPSSHSARDRDRDESDSQPSNMKQEDSMNKRFTTLKLDGDEHGSREILGSAVSNYGKENDGEISTFVIFNEDNYQIITEKDIRESWTRSSLRILIHKCEIVRYDFPNVWRLQTYSDESSDYNLNERSLTTRDPYLKATVYLRAVCRFIKTSDKTAIGHSIQSLTDKAIQNGKQVKIIIQPNRANTEVIVVEPVTSVGNDAATHGHNRLRSPGDSPENRKRQDHDDHHVLDYTSKRPKSDDDLENNEINERNWYSKYSATMPRDLKDWISSEHQKVFEMKWNAQEFIKQFESYSIPDVRLVEADVENEFNRLRHFIRLTVMLNTFGIVRREFYEVGGKRIRLSNDKISTTVFNENSMILKGSSEYDLKSLHPPFDSTEVSVIDEDCIVAYKIACDEHLKPLLLNMANAFHPGGGYRRGDGAQEESIFRRSNYYKSLDKDFDFDKQRRDRQVCTQYGSKKPISSASDMYPIHVHGAIYTEGLTFFRDTEKKGYALLEKPLENVCAIAVSAYRDPKLDGNRLRPFEEAGTRKKIENMFAIAHSYKHDCLILSALGCGAFKNPPDHVAEIFKSVIQQYAGFFKRIYFAIIDDHNTGKDFNPNGNFQPFSRLLDGKKFRHERPTAKNPVFGPHIISKSEDDKWFLLSDVMISSPTRCRYGAECYTISNEKHEKQYSHPTLCRYSKSREGCRRLHNEEHRAWFRHLTFTDPSSPKPSRVVESENNDVFNRENICSWTPFLCPFHTEVAESERGKSISSEAESHCKKFLHICRFGSVCDKKSELHQGTMIHVPRPECRYGKECRSKSNEEHLESFSHPDIPDIRRVCRDPGYVCTQRNRPEHFMKYRHKIDFFSTTSIPINDLSLNISFLQNQRRLEESTMWYINQKHVSLAQELLNEMKLKVRRFQTIYRCPKLNFKAFLKLGMLLSQNDLKELSDTKKIGKWIEENKLLDRIGFKNANSNAYGFLITSIQRSPESSSSSSSTSYRGVFDYDENKLARDLEHSEIERLKKLASDISEISRELRLDLKGDDKAIDDSMIRAKFGNSINCREDHVIIILKKQIVHHFDSNISIRPECSFTDKSVFTERPWTPTDNLENAFKQSKIHLGVRGCDDLIAKDLCLTYYQERRYAPSFASILMDFSKTIRYKSSYEAHLPSFIPLDCIDEVYLTEATSRDLSSVLSTELQRKLKIIRYTHSADSYTSEVNRLINERLEKPKNIHDNIFGFCCDIERCSFKVFHAAPFRLDHLENYHMEKDQNKSKPTDVYIYWQSIDGDLLMALSTNLEINEHKSSLLCHIGQPPSEYTEEYREKKSYLHIGSPLEHEMYLRSSDVTSNDKFHRGTNTENFLTYCLRLNKKDGRVTLSHAGSNSIYNKQKIEINVPKHSLNIDDLRFIHLSTGNGAVRIRNLIVTFSPVERLHPKFERADSSDEKTSKSLWSSVKEGFSELLGMGNHDKERHSEESRIHKDPSSPSSSSFSPSAPRELSSGVHGQSRHVGSSGQSSAYDPRSYTHSTSKDHHQSYSAHKPATSGISSQLPGTTGSTSYSTSSSAYGQHYHYYYDRKS